MTYVMLFLPSIFALIAFLMTLKFGKSKNGLIIGLVVAMAVFLYVSDKYPIIFAFNTIVLAFTAAYFAVFIYGKIKQRKGKQHDA